MERETKNIKIGEHQYTVKTYATARESHTIQQAYFIGTKMEVVGDAPKISEFNPGVQFEVYQEMIKQIVLAMDEVRENIVERCLDLPSTEFDELIAELDALISKKKS